MPSTSRVFALLLVLAAVATAAAQNTPADRPTSGDLSQPLAAAELPFSTPPAVVLPAESAAKRLTGEPATAAPAGEPRAESQPPAGQPQAAPPTKTRQQTSIPLADPARPNVPTSGKPFGELPSMVTVGGSLAVVLGLFFLCVWVMRGAAPKGSSLLPGEVFEVLGRAPLASRQQVHLLRCGNKLLLVSVTPTGTETLTEVTEPAEVDRLAGMCRQSKPHSATAAFRQVLEQLAPRQPGRAASRTHELEESDA
jgi:flagellar protein FliO/FliZ